jgi:hypothetical protein
MSKQVHFVIVADLDSETWWIDEELTYARLNETTWDEDAGQWETTTTDDYYKSLQILNKGRES